MASKKHQKFRTWVFKTDMLTAGSAKEQCALDALNALHEDSGQVGAIVWQKGHAGNPGLQQCCVYTGFIRFKKQPYLSTIHKLVPTASAKWEWAPATGIWGGVDNNKNLTGDLVAEKLLGGAQNRIGGLVVRDLPCNDGELRSKRKRSEKECKDLEIKEFIESGATTDDIRENYFSEYKAHGRFWNQERERHREREAMKHLCRLTYDDLVPWQQKLVDICRNKPHPRKIYWYGDLEGGRGKSEMTRYLQVNLSAYIASNAPNLRDIMCGYDPDAYTGEDGHSVVIFEYARALSSRDCYCYEGMEAFKVNCLKTWQGRSMLAHHHDMHAGWGSVEHKVSIKAQGFWHLSCCCVRQCLPGQVKIDAG